MRMRPRTHPRTLYTSTHERPSHQNKLQLRNLFSEQNYTHNNIVVFGKQRQNHEGEFVSLCHCDEIYAFEFLLNIRMAMKTMHRVGRRFITGQCSPRWMALACEQRAVDKPNSLAERLDLCILTRHVNERNAFIENITREFIAHEEW